MRGRIELDPGDVTKLVSSVLFDRAALDAFQRALTETGGGAVQSH